jgi:hypothetical protein
MQALPFSGLISQYSLARAILCPNGQNRGRPLLQTKDKRANNGHD